MFTIEPRVAVNGAWPSISTRTSPSTTANHSRVSGCSRFGTLVPGAAATYSPRQPSIVDDQLAPVGVAFVLRLEVGSFVHDLLPRRIGGRLRRLRRPDRRRHRPLRSCARTTNRKEPPSTQRTQRKNSTRFLLIVDRSRRGVRLGMARHSIRVRRPCGAAPRRAACELFFLRAIDRREAQVQLFHRVDDRLGDDQAGEPLVIRGNDEPRRLGVAVCRIMSS